MNNTKFSLTQKIWLKYEEKNHKYYKQNSAFSCDVKTEITINNTNKIFVHKNNSLKKKCVDKFRLYFHCVCVVRLVQSVFSVCVFLG